MTEKTITRKNKISSKNQNGMTTLIVSIALLIITTMGVIFAANVGVMEKKISNNDLRASQALLAAQAGIDITLANISKFDLSNPTSPYMLDGSNFVTDADQAINYNDGSSTVITGYYNITIDTSAADYPEKITIIAEGKSDDLTATAKISQGIIFAPAIQNANDNNYLNKAVLIVDGNAEIDENIISKGNSSNKVWARGTINGELDPTDPSNLTTNNYLVADSSYVRHNNVDPLNRLFLSSMRGALKADTSVKSDDGIKHVSTRSKCSSACTNPTTLTDSPNAKMHYLEGDVTLSGTTLGTKTSPVIIIIDNTEGNNFTLDNTTINGLLLIKGDWDNASKTATVNGNIVIEGGSLLNGKFISINYDTDVDTNLNKVGTYVRIPGGWNDIN